MIPALTEAEASVTIALYIARCSIKGVVRIHINAAQGVHDVDKAPEIDATIIGGLGSVEIIQHSHALLHAIHTGVGQLIQLTVEGQRQVVVPGGIDEKDLTGLGVHHRQNIHIAAALGVDVGVPLVAAAAIDHKGLLGDGAGGLDRCDLVLGYILVDNFGSVREVAVILLLRQQRNVALVENHSLDLIVVQGICHSGWCLVFPCVDLAHALLHGTEELPGVLLVTVGQDTEFIASGIAQLCGVVLFHDDHRRHLLFHHDAGDLI